MKLKVISEQKKRKLYMKNITHYMDKMILDNKSIMQIEYYSKLTYILRMSDVDKMINIAINIAE